MVGSAAVLVVLLTSSVVTIGQVRHRMTDQTERAAVSTAQVVAELAVVPVAGSRLSANQGLSAGERTALDDAVRALVAKGRLTGVEIWGWSGDLVYGDPAHPVEETRLPVEELARSHRGRVWVQPSESTERGLRTFEVFVPYDADGDGEFEAIVEVLTAQSDISRQVRQATRLFEIVVLAMVLAIGVVLVVARRRLLDRERVARHDTLTGLLNRAALLDAVNGVIRQRGRAPGPAVSLVLIDLDGFRAINDTLGYAAGDKLLAGVAGTLQAAVRGTDLLARLSGDEFAILMTSASGSRDPQALARGLLGRLQESRFTVDGVDLRVDAGIGVAVLGSADDDAEALLRRAQVSMYRAKKNGSGVAVHDGGSDTRDVQKLTLLAELRDGIQNDELVLHYQPKCRLATGNLVGVEALVRWRHPSQGLLSPDSFIPLAENTSLIEPLTTWVLREAARQTARWRAAGLMLPVAVNISPRSLIDGDLPGRILGVLAEERVPSDLLELEITETAIMTDPDRAIQVCRQLAAAGLRISIDDFGAGYTSLGFLRDLPVTTLKIDRSFITHLVSRLPDQAITRSIVELGHRLGLTVLAEGIEDDETRAVLAEMGCDEGQGYLISRPVPPEALETWIRERRTGSAPTGVDA